MRTTVCGAAGSAKTSLPTAAVWKYPTYPLRLFLSPLLERIGVSSLTTEARLLRIIALDLRGLSLGSQHCLVPFTNNNIFAEGEQHDGKSRFGPFTVRTFTYHTRCDIEQGYVSAALEDSHRGLYTISNVIGFRILLQAAFKMFIALSRPSGCPPLTEHNHSGFRIDADSRGMFHFEERSLGPSRSPDFAYQRGASSGAAQYSCCHFRRSLTHTNEVRSI